MTICSACSRESAPGARFCGSCGASLVSRVGVEERRHVTALFADLVGSTGLGEQRDPEVMRAIVGPFFELATDVVRGNGGSVEKFAGDSVLALFGLTVSHEDDAERAVRAGLLIRDAFVRLAADVKERHGISVALRLGAESGEVVVGDPFGGATMATGDVLNVAARLEQTAEPGEFLVGPEAHAATRTAIRYEPMGERAVRGRQFPIAAWRVLDARADLGGERGIPGLRAPLTGRDEELAILLGAQRRAVTERKAVLFTLIGVPGIGKSRLVREFSARIASDGARIVRGRCLPYGEGITYWPIAEIVREVAGITAEMDTEDATAALAAMVRDADVAASIGAALGLGSPSAGSSTVDRDIAWGLRRFVESVASEQPLVLVFEDVHWGEPAMLDLIEYLATWVRGVPVLLVCTSRPEFLDRRPAWGSGRIESSRIALEPLGRSDASRLLSALLDINDLPAALRDRVLQRAEGNPLFVEEVVRMLIDRGLIVLRDGRWVATPEAHDVAVPESVEAIIRARLDTLPRPERALLQVASVVGRIFERSAVATLIDDGEPVEPRLDEAVLRDLVTEEPVDEPSYRFKHILIRDVAYASLPKARRADLHARVAGWLADRGAGRTDEVADIRAYHLEQAVQLSVEVHGRVDPGLRHQAIEAMTASADRASEREDFKAQESFARRILDLPGSTEPPSLDLRWRLVDALYRQSDIRNSGRLAAELANDARAVGRGDIEGRALFAAASDVWVSTEEAKGGVESARRDLDRSIELLTAAGDTGYRFDAEFLHGYVGWWYGDLEQAHTGWERARATARQIGDARREAIALVRLASVRRYQVRPVEAQVLYEEAHKLAESSGSRSARALSASAFGNHISTILSNAEATPLWREALGLYEELGDRGGIGTVLHAMGVALVRDGVPDEGAAMLRRATALFEEIGHGGYLVEAKRDLAFALLEAGEIVPAEEQALAARGMVADDDPASGASTRMTLGQVRVAQLRDEEAEALLKDAIEIVERTQYRLQYAECYLAFAEFLLLRGRISEGEAFGQRARAVLAPLGARSESVQFINRRLAVARKAGGLAQVRPPLGSDPSGTA